MSLARFALLFLALLSLSIFAPYSRGQIPPSSSTTSTPVPGAGHDYLGGVNETVNPVNGSVSVRIPVIMPPGRGITLPFFFAYDSNGVNWLLPNPGNGPGIWNTISTVTSQGGWSNSAPVVTSVLETWTTQPEGAPKPTTCYATINFEFQDAFGNRHNLDLSNNSFASNPNGACATDTWNWPSVWFTGAVVTQGGQGSILATIPTSWSQSPAVTVTDGDGTVFSFPGSGTEGAVPTSVTDRNGNTITIANSSGLKYTDTAGRTVLQDSGFAVSPESVSVSGLGAAYTLDWTALSTPTFTTPITTESGTCSATHFNWSSVKGISSATLPNGQSFSFTYDPVYGLVNKITYPTGGYVRYVYGMNSQAEIASNLYCTMLYGVPAITDRYVSFDGTHEVLHQNFSYSTTWNYPQDAQWVSKQTTVTTYDLVRNTNFQTIYTYGGTPADDPPNSGPPTGTDPVERAIAYKDTSGSLLETVSKYWYNVRLLATAETTYPNGQSSLVSYCYNSNEEPTETDQYNFGTTNPTLPSCNIAGAPPGASYGSLVKKTVTTYAPSTAMTAQHVIDKPSKVQVYDSTGTNLVAETDYTYDTPVGTLTSGIVQHNTGCNCGNLTTQSKWLNTTGGSLSTNFTNDNTGQRLTMTDPVGNITHYSYTDSYSSGTPPGPTNAYLTTLTLPPTANASHIEKYAYAYASGEVTSSTDQNSKVTNYKYVDNLARLTETDYPDGGKTTMAYDDAVYNPSTPSPSVTTTKAIISSTNLVSVSAMDGLGHTVETELTSDPDGTDYTVTTLDGLARPLYSYNPTRCSPPITNCGESTWGYTTYNYDGLGRTTSVTAQDGSGSTTTYLGSCTTFTDPATKSRESCNDSLGRLTQLFEDPGSSPHLNYETDYTYDALNDLLTVNQKGGTTNSALWRTRTFTYDSLSRLTSAINPESNTVTATGATLATTYTYDSNSNLLQKTSLAPDQTSSSTVTISYCYDPLNRVTGKAYTAQTCSGGVLPSPLVSYYYDQASYSGLTITNGIGLRTGMADQAGTEVWSFDSMGRTLVDQRTTNSLTKSTTYVYPPYVDGSVYTITYPSGRTLTYSTGGAERLLSAQDNSTSVYYANAAHYAPPGGLSSLTNGAVLYSTQLYNSRLQPCWLYSTTGTPLPTNTACTASDPTPGNILDLNYNFNFGSTDNGNVMGITNNRSTTRSQSFAYDSLNRIATAESTSTYATSPANCWGESYFFDNNSTTGQGAWGNLTSTLSPSSAYTGCVQESNLSVSVSPNNQLSQSSNFCYDSAGNLVLETACPTGSFTPVYSFDAENHLISTAGVNYVYDGDGKRVEKSVSGSVTKIYWYDHTGNVLDETDGTGSATNSAFNEYVLFGGQRLAHRDSSNDAYYYFADHLGTSRTLAEIPAGLSTATLCYDADFDPFGGERTPIVNTCLQNYKFTGKERDSESGLDNSVFRYYGSSLGRFMSPDPSGMDLANPLDPQQLNLYAYARNNPLTFTDPFGLDCAYLNNAGNGIESVDTNSSGGECQGTGGYWVSGQVNQVSVNDNGTYNFGYSGMGPDGNLQSITYNNYVAPLPPGAPNIPSQCGYDLRCDSQGNILGMTRNMESANGTNFLIGGLFGAGIKLGAGLLGGLFDAGAEDATTVIFGHGARHLAGSGLQQAAVEKAITTQVQKAVAGSAATGEFWGKVVVDGQQVFYRAFTLPNGTINVGTYTVGAP
jgi:RHS repeat-associated protein